MSGMGQHSAGKGGTLRRAWISAWIVTLAMGGTTMAFQVYHSIKHGQMPWELAVLYGIVPLLIAMLVLEIVAEWKAAPWAAKASAYLIMGAAMFLSASATGAVVLNAAPPHFSLLFGALLDGAELLAAYFIMNGPRKADAAARAEADEALRAASQAAADGAQAALRAELRALGERFAAAETARSEAETRAAETTATAERQTAELAAIEAAQTALRDQLETAQGERDAADRGRLDAEQRAAGAEAQTAKLTRKLAASSGAKDTRNAGAKKPATSSRKSAAAAPETELPDDFDAQTEALRILAAEPDISGAKLAERVGKSERWGQLFKSNLAKSAPKEPDAGNGEEPS